MGSIATFPPAATAVFTSWSTSDRLLHESANSPSDCDCVLQISLRVNVLKKGSVSSITNASSLTTMQAAFSSVNCGLNAKPSLRKKSIERFRSRTARLTNSLRERLSGMCGLQEMVSSPWTPRRAENHRSRPASTTAEGSGELCRQSESGEELLGIEERGPARNLICRQLQHDHGPGPKRAVRSGGLVVAKGRRAAGGNRHQPRSPTARAAAEQPASDRLAAAKPERIRRHRERRVLAQQGRERIDVVAVERLDVSVEKPGLRLGKRPAAGAHVAGGEGCTRALQRAVHRRNGGLERLGHFRRGPAQHLREQERRALPRRKMLQRGHEREADALPQDEELRWVGIGGESPPVPGGGGPVRTGGR